MAFTPYSNFNYSYRIWDRTVEADFWVDCDTALVNEGFVNEQNTTYSKTETRSNITSSTDDTFYLLFCDTVKGVFDSDPKYSGKLTTQKETRLNYCVLNE